jgi:hypothetical protein
VKNRRSGQRTINIVDEREWMEKDAATKFLQQADGGRRKRKWRPRRQSPRQHQIAIDKARFAAEMKIYERMPETGGQGRAMNICIAGRKSFHG